MADLVTSEGSGPRGFIKWERRGSVDIAAIGKRRQIDLWSAVAEHDGAIVGISCSDFVPRETIDHFQSRLSAIRDVVNSDKSPDSEAIQKVRKLVDDLERDIGRSTFFGPKHVIDFSAQSSNILIDAIIDAANLAIKTKETNP